MRGHRGIDDVDARVGRAQNAAGVDAAGVVRVEVDRHADFLAQRLDQRVRRVRLAQAGHVLDAQDVRAHLHQLLGQLHVILQVVFGALGIEDVAGVADGRFADGVGVSRTASIASFMLSAQLSESKMRNTSMPARPTP